MTFNRRTPPTLADISRALETALRATGCPNCGLGGLDVVMDLGSIVYPQPIPWVVTVQGVAGVSR